MALDGIEWTVMTWNIQGNRATDLDRVGTVIQEADADVIVLQEVRQPQAERLERTLQMAMTWDLKHNPWTPFLTSRAEGAATLTPHDLSGTGHERISDVASIRSYRRRIVQWSVVRRHDDAGASVRVFNLHLSPHGLEAERRAEAQRVAAIEAGFDDDVPSVVAGDFNDDGTAEIIDTLPGVEPVPSPPTNPSRDPVKRLDHVLVPPAATDVSVAVPEGGPRWAALSDHLPLTTRFTLVPRTVA